MDECVPDSTINYHLIICRIRKTITLHLKKDETDKTLEMDEFIRSISERYGIEREAVEELAGYATQEKIRKNSILVEHGGFNNSFHIVVDGILRAFRSPTDRDLTLWFAFPGDIVVDMFCYYGGMPSPIGIEAETDASLFVISKTALSQACRTSLPAANAVLRIFERHSFVFEENILSLWDCNDGSERYMSILRRHPQLLQNVPLKKLASYLKVTPQSLSRIRAGIHFLGNDV